MAPTSLVEHLKAALAPGSALVMTHVTPDFAPTEIAGLVRIYESAGTAAQARTLPEFTRFFDGWSLIAPGTVPTPTGGPPPPTRRPPPPTPPPTRPWRSSPDPARPVAPARSPPNPLHPCGPAVPGTDWWWIDAAREAGRGMLLGLTTALVATVCFGFGAVFQARGARSAPQADRVRAGLLAALARSWEFLLGTVLDIVGFALSIVALRSLPLFLVQAVTNASLAVTALAAVRLLGARLRRGT